MFNCMYVGLSGMRNHQVRMDVIGNNMANSNTTGFKSGRANFADAMYMALDSNGSQIGSGLTVPDVSNNFTQGLLMLTGRTMDLAISGNGFFGVTDDDDNLRFTRDGSFYIDNDGYIVNASGLKLVDSNEDSIQLDLADGQSIENIYINDKGEIMIIDSSEDADQSDDPVAQIGLYNFKDVNGLTNIGDNLYIDNNISGEPIEGVPGEDSFGTISSGYLESSNIDMVQEMTDLIQTQRAYQASTKVFSTADEVLQLIVDLKR